MNKDFAIDPIAFYLGDLAVSWYGIFIFFGFITSILLVTIKLKFWYKIFVEPFYWFCFIAIPTSILGARLWSFIIGDAQVGTNSNFFLEFWNFQAGGLAIQGGIAAALICGLIYFPLILRRSNYFVKTSFKNQINLKQISTFVYADAILPAVLVGQAIGRWGNMFNQEIYGSVVHNPEKYFDWLKFIFPSVYEQMFISTDGSPEFRQPLFLYESFANIILFIFLWIFLEFFYKRKAGDLAVGYFLGYSIIRLIMEPFRADKYEFVLTIVITSLTIIFSITFLFFNHFFISKNREKKILFMIYIYTKFYFKKIKYKLSKKYKKYIDKNFPNFKNYGEVKKISFKRKTLLYYNGI